MFFFGLLSKLETKSEAKLQKRICQVVFEHFEEQYSKELGEAWNPVRSISISFPTHPYICSGLGNMISANGSKNANKCVTSRSWIYSLYIQYYKLFRVCVHARACGRKERRFRSLLKLLVILQWHSICPYNVGQKCGTIIPCSHAQIQDQLNIVVRNMHGMALLRPQNILPHTMTPSSRTHMRKRDSRVIKI